MTDTGQHDSQEYLVISIRDQLCALPSAAVEYALPPGDVSPLPFVPEFVLGLISVNEQIMPLIDLQSLFGLETDSGPQHQPETGKRNRRAELVVVSTGRSRCALHCQQIVSTTTVANADINSDPNDGQTNPDALILALCSGRFSLDRQPVLILEPGRIGELISPRHMEPGEPGLVGTEQEHEEKFARQRQFLLFRAGQEQFSLRLEDVVEILDLPASSPMAGAPEEAEGVQIVRGEVLVVLALKTMLGISGSSPGHSPVIVIEYSGRSYGLRVDEVLGINSYSATDAKVIEDDSGDIAEVVVEGEDVIALLTPARLISHDRRARLAPFIPASSKAAPVKEEPRKSVLMTRLGSEWIGIPVEIIASIAELTTFEPVKADNSPLVRGALSLKGQILPVLDSEALLGQTVAADQQHQDSSQKGAWIVLGENDKAWALAVSEAREIIDIPESRIKPVEAARARFVYALANIDGRLLSLVDLGPLERAA